MREGINPMQRMLRMRARPKILLAETYEEALDLYERFSDNVLGIISDIRFPRAGILFDQAGLEFTRLVKKSNPHLPVLLQSSDGQYAAPAAELGAHFLNKRSRRLLQDLRTFILGNLGFGDFVFVMPDGKEVGRAADLRSFETVLRVVPEESLGFHAGHNHFSNWLMARSEFEMATLLRARNVEDFENLEAMRRYLIDTLAEFRERSQSGVVADFSATKYGPDTNFVRIGSGSIGGKARGLAFVNALLRRHNVRHRFDRVRIAVPNTAAIGTDVFDTFVHENRLHRFMEMEDVDDAEVARAFLQARLPPVIHGELAAFLRLVRYPLAVRSSSLQEDSQDRPFAGIYTTYMLANNHSDLDVRLDQLCDAIKLVYASTFFRGARRYLEATGHHAEEEKMGVILQEIVGSPHGTRFYPTFSGVARSYNYYPAAQMTPEEGVSHVALGLGKTVVEGGESLMFSPAHPHILPQFPTPKDMLANAQREFFALDVGHGDAYPTLDSAANLVRCGLDVAEADGALSSIGSVYCAEDDMVHDGILRPGPRLVTFAHVLKADVFPLADVLRLLLDVGREGMGCPVEIEFAVDLSTRPMEFGFLQIRPLVSEEEFESVHLEHVDVDDAVCFSTQSLGNGRMSDVHDVVYVKPDAFDASKTNQIATEVGRVNETLRKEGRSCVLIGPGRWGTADPWLGVPATWQQISTAQVLVETSLRDFVVAPSQGTHFFQNLTSLRIGYLAVN
ncbi:MAG: PEP/pyruvate-binding domain-containing protein, partial [Phycisphaerae bacterium]